MGSHRIFKMLTVPAFTVATTKLETKVAALSRERRNLAIEAAEAAGVPTESENCKTMQYEVADSSIIRYS